MELAIIGLGKMGSNMARRLLRHGHQIIGYNRSHEITMELKNSEGMIAATDISEVLSALSKPRIIWLMLPAGEPTETTIQYLSQNLNKSDYVINGANSYYRDTLKHAKIFSENGINFLDAGVSGGIWGLQEGYSLMIGGDEKDCEYLQPIFESLAPDREIGWGRVGKSGSGHFVKMVHNGIEYGLMEAYAEGFEILQEKKEFALDLLQISQIWQHGSVVRSWLLDLIEAAIKLDPSLVHIKGWVADSGEGRWTVNEAIDLDVSAPIIALSLFRRFESRSEDSYSFKLLAAMRNQFGGHSIVETD